MKITNAIKSFIIEALPIILYIVAVVSSVMAIASLSALFNKEETIND